MYITEKWINKIGHATKGIRRLGKQTTVDHIEDKTRDTYDKKKKKYNKKIRRKIKES